MNGARPAHGLGVIACLGALALTACGGGDAPSATAATATASAGNPTLGKDDCTTPGLAGTAVRNVYYDTDPFTVILADHWSLSPGMGTQGVTWSAGDDDDPQGTTVEVALVGVAPDAVTAATGDAHDRGVPVLTCSLGGEPAYLVTFRGPQGAAQYDVYARHIDVQLRSSGHVPESAWVPQVKAMLGSWTWSAAPRG